MLHRNPAPRGRDRERTWPQHEGWNRLQIAGSPGTEGEDQHREQRADGGLAEEPPCQSQCGAVEEAGWKGTAVVELRESKLIIPRFFAGRRCSADKPRT